MSGAKRSNRRMLELASSRISYLHELAVSRKGSSQSLSRRYMSMAERIGKRMDMTLPAEIKRSYCKRCATIYGAETRIRLKKRMLEITCAECGDVRRIPY